MKQNTRHLLIESGIDIMLERGYNATGLNDVLNACNVPKGSFYHYFSSKEIFGIEVIHAFDGKYIAQIDRVLRDRSLTPLERLERFIDDAITRAEKQQCSRGCLIANLSQEMSDQNESLRQQLEQILLRRRSLLADVIREAQAVGQIDADLNAAELAEYFLSTFEGAVMRSKALRQTAPLLAFRKIFLKSFSSNTIASPPAVQLPH